MQAGKLRHYVTLQQKTETRDARGGYVESWATFASVWASIEPLQGVELLAAQQVTAETEVRIRIRYIQNLSTVKRVLFGSRIFEILGIVNPEERNIQLVLNCKELK